MQTLTWILIGIALTGLTLWGVGFLRGSEKWRGWKRVRADRDGEPVLGESAMQTGQSAVITAGSPASCPQRPGALIADIVALNDTTLTFRVTRDTRAQEGESVAWPPQGATVKVTFAAPDAVYRCSLLVCEAPPATPDADRLLVLSRPAWMARIQRRRHFRADVDLPAILETTSSQASAEDKRPRTNPERIGKAPLRANAVVTDLSAGGFRAFLPCGDLASLEEASSLMEPSSVIKTHLRLPALSETPLAARIVSADRQNDRDGCGLRLTCEFLPMDAWEQDLLQQYLFSEQRKGLRARFRADEPDASDLAV